MRLLILVLLAVLGILEFKVSDRPRCTLVGKVRTCDVFSKNYDQAQKRFVNVASFCDVLNAIEVVPGYDMDVCLIRGTRPGVVVHVSGTHGIEGFAGSAIQIALLAGGLPEHYPTILLVHAFNPYGMAHFRRFNENNVDLNRNGLTEDEWKDSSHWSKEPYDKFRDLFHPDTPVGFWNAKVYSWWTTMYHVVKYGTTELKTAMVRGQYHDPSGIFYGGDGAETSLVKLLEYIRTFDIVKEDQAVTWIDVHTGLGPSGIDTIMPSRMTPIDDDGVQHYFPGCLYADENAKAVNEGYEDVKGLTIDYFYRNLLTIDRKHLFCTQEFGTLPPVLVGNSMVVENAAYHDDTLSASQKIAWAKSTTKATFYPNSERWRVRVLERGILRLHQAMHRSMEKSRPPGDAAEAEPIIQDHEDTLDRSEL